MSLRDGLPWIETQKKGHLVEEAARLVGRQDAVDQAVKAGEVPDVGVAAVVAQDTPFQFQRAADRLVVRLLDQRPSRLQQRPSLPSGRSRNKNNNNNQSVLVVINTFIDPFDFQILPPLLLDQVISGSADLPPPNETNVNR